VEAGLSGIRLGNVCSLLPAVIRQLLMCPQTGKEIYSLSGGQEHAAVLPSDEGNLSLVDVQRLIKIVKNNSFAVAKDNLDTLVDELRGRAVDPANEMEQSVVRGAGLWILPSFFNHSCMNNCFYFFVGDFIIILTSKHVSANTELTITYTDVQETFDHRRKMLTRWNSGEGFECLCERCQYCRSHPDYVELENHLQSLKKRIFNIPADRVCYQIEMDKIFPPKDRKAMQLKLEKYPLEGQSLLVKLYEMEARQLLDDNDHEDELLAYCQKAVSLESRIFGVHPQNAILLKYRIRLIYAALINLQSEFFFTNLSDLYKLHCCPPWGLLPKEDFHLLCSSYVHKGDYWDMMESVIFA
jgi:hypothetical protein